VRCALLAALALLSAGLYLAITLAQLRTPRDANTYILLVGALFVLYAIACLIILAGEHSASPRRYAARITHKLSGRDRSWDEPDRVEQALQRIHWADASPWLELAVIIAGVLLFSALVFPDWPNLSRDSWRYIWDPQVIVHGFNPYLVAPDDPRLRFLRHANPLIYANMRFRNVPTICPLGAQALYLIIAFISPTIYSVKGMMTLLNLIAAALLMVLLHRRGQDLRRVIIYLWNPLPILEYVLNGHIDVAAIVWILLALLIAETVLGSRPAYLAANSRSQRANRWQWAWRALIGFLLGLATLTKLWPVILVIAFANLPPLLRGKGSTVMQWERAMALDRSANGPSGPARSSGPLGPREPQEPRHARSSGKPRVRRLGLMLISDWPLYAAMVATILIGYAPFAAPFLRHGLAAAGFLVTYLDQNQPGAGPIVLLIRWAGVPFHLMHWKVFHNSVGHYVEVGAAALALLGALIARLRYRTTPAAMTLALVVIWLATSPHVFAWYVAVLLPLLALYLAWPVWRSPAALAALGLWLFTGLVQVSYVGYLPGRPLDMAYYEQYLLPAALLGSAVIWWLLRRHAPVRIPPPAGEDFTPGSAELSAQRS
jgi:hypothetical protein